jgi:hypothetical protein
MRERRERRTRTASEGVMVQNAPDLTEGMNPYIQEAPQIPRRKNRE